MLGEKQVVQLLLQQDDIELNCVDKHGRGAQHLAAELQNAEIMEILYESRQFDITAKDKDGQTPADIASSNESYAVINFLQDAMNFEAEELEEDIEQLEEEDQSPRNGHHYHHDKRMIDDDSPLYSIKEKGDKFKAKVAYINDLFDSPQNGNDSGDLYMSPNDEADFLQAEKLANDLCGIANGDELADISPLKHLMSYREDPVIKKLEQSLQASPRADDYNACDNDEDFSNEFIFLNDASDSRSKNDPKLEPGEDDEILNDAEQLLAHTAEEEDPMITFDDELDDDQLNELNENDIVMLNEESSIQPEFILQNELSLDHQEEEDTGNEVAEIDADQVNEPNENNIVMPDEETSLPPESIQQNEQPSVDHQDKDNLKADAESDDDQLDQPNEANLVMNEEDNSIPPELVEDGPNEVVSNEENPVIGGEEAVAIENPTQAS